jgi:CheY-like chemotaxis protein
MAAMAGEGRAPTDASRPVAHITGSDRRPRRVVVADDNELTLPGYVGALRGCPDVDVVAAFGHDAALAWAGDWSRVDVAVVDAADESAEGDQFPGVAVVRRIRAGSPDGATTVVVVTGHYLHDGLRHRMATAGADFFFLRSELRSSDGLVDVVLHPERYRRGVAPVADPGALPAMGVAPGADIESLVAYVEEEGMGPLLDHDGAPRDAPRARRWVRHRRAMAAAGGIEPVNVTTGDRPRGQDTPSIRQLARVWNWAARIRRPGD